MHALGDLAVRTRPACRTMNVQTPRTRVPMLHSTPDKTAKGSEGMPSPRPSPRPSTRGVEACGKAELLAWLAQYIGEDTASVEELKDGYAFARAVMRAHHSVDIRLPMKRIAAQHMQAGGAVFEQRTKTFTLLLESLRALGVKPLSVDAFGLSQGNLVRRLEEGPAAGPAATPPELPLLLVQAASRCAGRPAFRMLKRDRAAQRDRSDCRLHRLQRTLACSH